MQVSCAPGRRAAAARAQWLGQASGCGMGRGARLVSSSSSSFLTLLHLEGAQQDQDAPELRNTQDHRHSLVCSATLASWENKPQATRPGRRKEASPRPPLCPRWVAGGRLHPGGRSPDAGSGVSSAAVVAPCQTAGASLPPSGGEGGELSPSPQLPRNCLLFAPAPRPPLQTISAALVSTSPRYATVLLETRRLGV